MALLLAGPGRARSLKGGTGERDRFRSSAAVWRSLGLASPRDSEVPHVVGGGAGLDPSPTLYGDARQAALAAYFIAFLDQRCPLPIANDLSFHLKLYQAALEQDWCRTLSNRGSFVHQGLSTIGFEPPVYCDVDHTTFAQFLRAQTAAHLPRIKEVTNHGMSRVHRLGRLLPNAAGPAQLSLFA